MEPKHAGTAVKVVEGWKIVHYLSAYRVQAWAGEIKMFQL